MKKGNKFDVSGEFKRIFTPEAEEKNKEEDGYLRIEGYANTTIVDRVNTYIPSEEWAAAIEHFMKNPIILFNHNYDEPVGKAEEIRIDDKGLYIKVAISPKTKEGKKVIALIEDKILKSFSVGFRIKDYEAIEYNEDRDAYKLVGIDLLEVSVVTVPANQESLFDISKSFDSPEQYEEFMNSLKAKAKSAKETKLESEENTDSEKKELDIDSDSDIQTESEADSTNINEGDPTMDNENKTADVEDTSTDATVADAPATEKAPAQAKSDSRDAGQRVIDNLNDAFDSGDEAVQKAATDILRKNIKAVTETMDNKRNYEQNARNDVQFSDKDLAAKRIVCEVKGLDFASTPEGMQAQEKTILGTASNLDDAVFTDRIFSQIQPQLKVAPQFDEHICKAGSNFVPIMNDIAGTGIFMKAPGGLSGASANPAGTTPVQEAMKEVDIQTTVYMKEMMFDVAEEENTIINLYQTQERAATRSIAKRLDRNILTGNGTFRGASTPTNQDDSFFTGVHNKANAVAALRTITGGNTTAANADVVRSAMKKMGNYLPELNDIVLFTSQATYNELVDHEMFLTAEKFGNNAGTSRTGVLGKFYGVDVINTAALDAPGANKCQAVFVYTPGYLVGRQGGVSISSEVLGRSDTMHIYVRTRFGFQTMSYLDGEALGTGWEMASTVVSAAS